MTHKKIRDGFLLVFHKDEKLIENLLEFIEKQNIKSAWLSGLGGVQGVELGFYDLDAHEYQWQTKVGLAEIANLTGNIAWQDEKPVVHAHITLTDSNLRAFGGHLHELVVGGTCEIYVKLLDKSLQRNFDSETGLNLFT